MSVALRAGNRQTVTVPEGARVIVRASGGIGPAGPTGPPGSVDSVVPGSDIDVDSTDPANPIVSVESTLNDKTLIDARANVIKDTDGDTAINILANGGTAVNYAEVRNAAAGSGVVIAAQGSDANINLTLLTKGLSQIFLSTAGLNYGGKNILGAWTAYTPTITGVTQGTGAVLTAEYMQIGKTIHFVVDLVLGTGGALTGAVSITLPVTASAVAHVRKLSAGLTDASSGVFYPAQTYSESTTTVSIGHFGGSPVSLIALGATAPFPWAVNDILHLHGTYEAA